MGRLKGKMQQNCRSI